MNQLHDLDIKQNKNTKTLSVSSDFIRNETNQSSFHIHEDDRAGSSTWKRPKENLQKKIQKKINSIFVF
jgi:hypothetical protein